MLTLKYSKEGSAVYISHIDMLRVINRIVRRTGVKSGFSQGYNPHMLVFMSSPLPIGISSRAEYATIDVDVDPDEFIEKINSVCLKDICVTQCIKSVKSPNVAGKACLSSYVYYCDEIKTHQGYIQELLDKKEYIITYLNKGKQETKDVRNLIHSIKITDTGIDFMLSSGNLNLRADRLIKNICQELNIDYKIRNIIRTAQYTIYDGKIIDIDDYIKLLSN